MIYQMFFLLLFIFVLIVYSAVKKGGTEKLNRILISAVLIICFGQIFFPRQIFGRWNSISKLDGKEVNKIILSPSSPDWQVNLVGKDFIISEKQQLDTLIYMLQKVEFYSPSHPTRTWETNLTMYCSDHDSLIIKIHQTDNTGTVIYTPTSDWRKDDIGSYLEKLTLYKTPVYGDKSKIWYQLKTVIQLLTRHCCQRRTHIAS